MTDLVTIFLEEIYKDASGKKIEPGKLLFTMGDTPTPLDVFASPTPDELLSSIPTDSDAERALSLVNDYYVTVMESVDGLSEADALEKLVDPASPTTYTSMQTFWNDQFVALYDAAKEFRTAIWPQPLGVDTAAAVQSTRRDVNTGLFGV